MFPVSYYAPSYPHYYLPAVQQKVAGAEAEDPRKELVKTVQYLPSILPSYQYYPFSSYIPRVVQPVQVSNHLTLILQKIAHLNARHPRLRRP